MTESKLSLIETVFQEKTVRMRYADHRDREHATTWIEFQVPLAELIEPIHQQGDLGDPEIQYLGAIRAAALRYVRTAVAGENQRLVNLVGHRR